MKVLNLKNLKNLEELGLVLKGNFGLKAKRNPSGSIAFRLQRRIKGKGVISRTLGYFPQMSIKEAEKESLRIANLCQKGIEPKEYDRLLEVKKQSSIDKDIRRQRTLGQTIKQYVDNKRLSLFPNC